MTKPATRHPSLNLRAMTWACSLWIALFLTPTLRAQVSTCPRSEGEAFLDVNNVRARIVNTGGLFYRGQPHVYNVPKYTSSNAIFASGIWIGGLIEGQIRMSASRYGEWEMWAGPLDDEGNPPVDCSLYDRIYRVGIEEIQHYEETGIVARDLADWPWELGAPVIDGDGDSSNYDLDAGDRPEILGHQSIWWVMNDRGNIHESSDSEPVGLEVRSTAFAAGSNTRSINNSTLYRYRIIYKGESPLEDAYFGIFVDPDLGDFSDDYVGADSTLGIGYVYNADNEDLGSQGYGTPPPATGFDIIQGPLVDQDGLDNDGDGAIDEAGERLSMTTFMTYNSGGGVNEDPATASDYYNYMQARWKDGSPIYYGGDGFQYGTTRQPTRFMYAGDPVTGEGWSELNPGIDGSLPPHPPADRRYMLATGPFTMQPGETQEIVFSVVWARGADHLDSVNAMKEAAIEVQNAYEGGFDIPLPTSHPFVPTRLQAPADRTSDQPTNPVLHWLADSVAVYYEVQWSTDASFADSVSSTLVLSNTHALQDLQTNRDYYWRVRPGDDITTGDWSETWQFRTSAFALRASSIPIQGFMAVQNAAGPIEPPDMAAFAFNSSGFPILEGRYTPVGSYPSSDRPTRGVQQSTNNSAWGIHAGESFLFDDGCGLNCSDTFVGKAIRNGWTPVGFDGYEWRFTQRCLDGMDGVRNDTDCLARRAFEDGADVEVPFELWNIGHPDSLDDDYRMIPFLCEEACSAGTSPHVFDFAGDHGISGGDNDPFSDWVYWNKPADNGAEPGEAGYRDYFFGQGSIGEEVFARTVLVQWNGWVDPDGDGNLELEHERPEPGTIFRIVTAQPESPLPASPKSGEAVSTSAPVLYWNAAQALYQVQVALLPDFGPTLVDTLVSDISLSLPELVTGQTYFWRIRLADGLNEPLSLWSATWNFVVPVNVSTEPEQESMPRSYALGANFPNPFYNTTTIEYELPEPAPVSLRLYNVLGQQVRNLVEAYQPAGRHAFVLNKAGLPSGTYFYRLDAGPFSQTRTMTLIR